MMSEIVAYKCEVYNPRDDAWNHYMGRDHPSDTFEHMEYRNVTPLVEADETTN